jgi:murein L,D-transpeptidase YcbB/YkuD
LRNVHSDYARACVHGIVWTIALCIVLFAATILAAEQPPARQWDRQSALALLAYIDRLDTHGLDPANYGPADLHAALSAGDPAAIEQRATRSFALVARDLATGRLQPDRRGRDFIPTDTLDPVATADLIDLALARKDVAGTLESLAPRDRQYVVLRAALTKLRPGDDRERRMIEANLERWRWLPHNLGDRYLMVNIPEYRARLFDNGRLIASHKVIVGKTATPTPQFRTDVAAVILNPSWSVPQSIIAESVGRLVRSQPAVARARGYTWSFAGGGLRVTQQPGPQNALGQMKLDMPNPFSVYMHDTPTKELFDRDVRTLSHGCIRTQNPFDLAAVLLAGSEWTPARIAETVGTGRTTRAALSRPVPVYVVYMAAVADDYGSVRYLADPYKLDQAIEAQLK